MNDLKINYHAKHRKGFEEMCEFTKLIDGERLLIENPDFPKMDLNSQREVVEFYIKEDRIRFKSKDFSKPKWRYVDRYGKDVHNCM